MVSIDKNGDYQRIARKYLSDEGRVQILEVDGLDFIEKEESNKFDFIYADTFPGKYIGFDHTLRILKHGGIIVLDDMLPQPNWPEDHPPKVERLLRTLDMLPTDQYSVIRLAWYTGHIIISARGPMCSSLGHCERRAGKRRKTPLGPGDRVRGGQAGHPLAAHDQSGRPRPAAAQKLATAGLREGEWGR